MTTERRLVNETPRLKLPQTATGRARAAAIRATSPAAKSTIVLETMIVVPRPTHRADCWRRRSISSGSGAVVLGRGGGTSPSRIGSLISTGAKVGKCRRRLDSESALKALWVDSSARGSVRAAH